MKFGSKDIPFVYKGDKLVYPNPIKDGLLLWYDFKGMRNTDVTKEVAKDLSGNGNDGTLTNFNFTEESGYKDNTLVFDGVDDSLTIPELELDETAMTVVHDGKLYAYEDDKVLTVGEDGEIVGAGQNLLVGSNDYWKHDSLTANQFYRNFFHPETTLEVGQPYIFSVEIERTSETPETVRLTFGSGTTTYQYDFSSGNVPSYDAQGQRVYTVFTPTERELQDHNKFAWRIRNDGKAIAYRYRKPKLEKGIVENAYSSNPKDYKTTTLTPTSLTDLQLYNKTLRKDELLHNAESKGLKKLKPGVVVQDGLVLHYDFSHESNNSEYKDKAFDYSGNGNHGVLNNFNFTEESGYEGGGLKFDGVDDVIDTNLSNLDIGNSTYETVVYYDRQLESQVYQVIMHTYSYWTDGIFLSGNSVRAFINNGTGNNLMYVPPQAKVKIHIVRVVDNVRGVMELYVNGVIVGSTNITSGVVDTRGNNLTLSNLAYTLHHPIYSTKVYNRALTIEEIAHNYQIEKEKFGIE